VRSRNAAQVEDEGVVFDPPDHRRRRGPELPRQRLCVAGEDHGCGWNSRRRESAAADRRRGLANAGTNSLRGQRRRERVRSALDLLLRGGQHRERRNVDDGSRRIAIDGQRRLESGERELVDAERAREWVLAHPGHQRRIAGDDPGLRPTEQLVAAHRDDRGPGAQCVARRRLAGEPVGVERDEQAAAEIVNERHVRLARERNELLDGDVGDESLHREVRAVDLEDRAGVGTQHAAIVVEMRAVRRAYLAQPRAALGHDIGNAEASPDLDQLPTRDDRLSALGHCIEHEHERGRAVVHDQRVLGAGELAQQRGRVRVARSPGAALEIVFEVAEALGDGIDGRAGGRGQRRASEVGVQDDAGGVDRRAQRRAGAARERIGDRVRPFLGRAWRRRRPDPRPADGVAYGVDHDRPRRGSQQLPDGIALEQRADARQRAAAIDRHRGGRAVGAARGPRAVSASAGRGVVKTLSLVRVAPLRLRRSRA
jgi:hypothetical protein